MTQVGITLAQDERLSYWELVRMALVGVEWHGLEMYLSVS